MSAEGSFGLNLAEKFFGLILLAIGALALYYTVTSAEALLTFTGFFAFLSIVIIILGLVMLTVKTE